MYYVYLLALSVANVVIIASFEVHLETNQCLFKETDFLVFPGYDRRNNPLVGNLLAFALSGANIIKRLQRVFHSLLTGRILLHLRMAHIQDERRQGATGPLDLDSIYAYRETEVGNLTTFAARERTRGTDTDISTDVYTDI